MFVLDHIGIDSACIPSLKTCAGKIEISTDHSFDLGRMLELQYHLLEYVFEHLETADLHSASLVNSTWDKAAKRELRKRLFPAWISCSYRRSLCSINASSGFKYINTAVCLIAYCPKTIKLEKYVCLHDEVHTSRMTFADYIKKEVVPHTLDYCIVSCTQVSPSNIESKNNDLLYQGIFIPYIPNIRTVMFYRNPKAIYHIPNVIKDNEQVKCLLVFTQKYRLDLAEFFLAALLKGQSSNTVAMGGGLIKSAKTFHPKNHRRLFRAEDLFCIALLQEEGVQADFNAYSTVIISDEDESIDADHYASFEKELVKFKETSVLRKHGVIFRFCCFAKSFKNQETAIIEKHFPKYPLLGMEVDGEIGWNTSSVEQKLDNKPEVSSKSKKIKAGVPQTLHGWSTVLVLITWGKTL